MTDTQLLDDAKAAHYVPKFYLKGFTGANRVLWVYEKFKAPRASKPKDEGHLPDRDSIFSPSRDRELEGLVSGSSLQTSAITSSRCG
jgi:hypothetical protein